MHSREIRREISRPLTADDFQSSLEIICSFGFKKAVSPLIALFNSRMELERWRAVSGLGFVTARLADELDMESARVVVRRLMWTLNDESGGIGWGSPQAMGEIMARHSKLALEFAKILVSYSNPSGNYLEHPLLQRGVLWGQARLAHARPELCLEAIEHIQPFLKSEDPNHRGLAAWLLTAFNSPAAEKLLTPLTEDSAAITLYRGHVLEECTVADLARQPSPSERLC